MEVEELLPEFRWAGTDQARLTCSLSFGRPVFNRNNGFRTVDGLSGNYIWPFGGTLTS